MLFSLTSYTFCFRVSFFNEQLYDLVLKSPCTIISPSLADPPTPHLLFSSLPSSFKSFSVPINPVINVTTLPPRFFLSMETRRLCLFCRE